MDVSVENKTIEIRNIFFDLGIAFSSECHMLDDLFDYSDKYIISSFPGIIEDSEKYGQVNIFYQKYLDGEISKQQFESREKQFHDFVKTLWIYNDVYAALFESCGNIIKYSRRAKIKKLIRSEKKLLSKVSIDSYSPNIDNVYRVSKYSSMNVLLHLATREISGLLLYFKQVNILIYLFGCEGILVLKNGNSPDDSLQDILRNNRLYIWK